MYRPYYVRACAQHFISSLSEATDCGRVAEIQHEDVLIVDFRFIESNRSSQKKTVADPVRWEIGCDSAFRPAHVC